MPDDPSPHARDETARLAAARDVALGAAHLGYWSLDLATSTLTASATCKANFGRPTDAPFTYADLHAAIHPGDRARVMDAIRRTVEDGLDYDVEYRVLRPDDGVGWVLVRAQRFAAGDGQPRRLAGVSMDITARKQAEDVLERSGARFRAIANSIDQMIWSTQPDGYHDYYNDRWYEYTGVPHGSTDGEAWNDMFHPDDRERAWSVWGRSLASGEPYGIEYRLRHRSGEYRWVLGRALPVRDGDGQIARWFGTCTDVHDLKAAEAALRRSDERYRTLIATLPQLVWGCRADGGCDYLSPQWVAYTGVGMDEQLGLDWLDRVIHPEDRERVLAHWMGAVAGRHPYDIEYRIRRHDGSYHWFKTRGTPFRDGDGAILSWFGTCTDIDEIVQAREVLTASHEALETLVIARTRERDSAWRNSRDLQLIVDGRGLVVAANAAVTTVLGYSQEELVGRPYREIVFDEDADAAARTVAAAIVRDLPARERRMRHRDGRVEWVSWVSAAQEGLIVASGRHVTAEKENALALAATQEQLRQSQKMEAVGQLTGGLAHDFNNLLTGITGSLELLQARIAQGRTGEVERYVTSAQNAARRAAALTHRLLAFSRRQTLDPKTVDVNRLVIGMEDLVRRTVGPAAHLEVVTAAALWPAHVDPNQLESALLNLCINGRDAMPDGGRITIETANKWIDERGAREHDLPAGQYVSLCVTDTGTGMTPEVLARAFDPFFTTKPLGMGTGLGLSMVYGFARQSGGQVRIYSEVGIGTTVCIYLPRHAGAVDADDLLVSGVLPRAEAGETVLVVDDEPTVRMLVVEVLQDLGYAALEAHDGAAGLRLVEAAARIDLLVTDVGLPGGMNGRQLADAARVVRPGLKVLFITGYAENAVVGNGHLEPGMALLTKPFTIDALAERIKDMIAGTA